MSVHGGAFTEDEASPGLSATLVPLPDAVAVADVALDESVADAAEPDEVEPPFAVLDVVLSESGAVAPPPQAAAAARKEKAQRVRLILMMGDVSGGSAKIGGRARDDPGPLRNPAKRCSYSACE